MSLFNLFRKNKPQKNNTDIDNSLKNSNTNNIVANKPGNDVIANPVIKKVTNNTVNKPIRRNYFYVYQNKTYHEERAGGFLWSPKYASGNRKTLATKP